ncbi:MAG TPA: hypothetical protein VFR29_10425 [Steroidobacteraceae bacterium]|nr:hypothetical protein [Steroidobacteraceae bacterium]
MTPADERVIALLQKWQKSLDLHARYADLPEDQYWLVQPWPNHQRPTKWVIDLARQRLADLQKIVQTRLATGDQSLSEGLELMSFLTNLVGSQHVDRFVPIAEPERERQFNAAPAPAKKKPAAATSTSTAIKPVRPPAPRAKTAVRAAKPVNDGTVTAIVKDATRLLSWGREWHELPEAIARIAGRPDVQQVRQILKSSKQAIEQRVAAQDKH